MSVEGAGGNREVPPKTRPLKEGGPWGKHGFPHGSEPQASDVHRADSSIFDAASTAADFTITASPGSVSVPWYSTARYTVTIASGSATTGAVSLSVSGLPSAKRVSFDVVP